MASFSAVEKEGDGGLVSDCVRAEGVRSLLPEADEVVLVREPGAGPAALGDWDRVVGVAGHLLEETEDSPPRHRTLGFPGEDDLRAIGMGEL